MTVLIEQFRIEWIDRGCTAVNPPNPAYPEGIDVDVSGGQEPSCDAVVPYPAQRCGLWAIHCRWCRKTVAVTTAGRPDDPRLVKIACGTRKE